jgi:hypothetical protein
VLERLAVRVAHGLGEEFEQRARLLAQLLLRDQLVAELVGFEPVFDPEVENLVAARGEQFGHPPRIGLVLRRGACFCHHFSPSPSVACAHPRTPAGARV